MKSLILTNKGIENISADEAKEIVEAKIEEIRPGLVIMDCENLEKLTYGGRTFNRTGKILAEFEFQDEEDLLAKIPDIKIEEEFGMQCDREGEHDFTSFDIAQQIAQKLSEKTGQKINYKAGKPYLAVIRDNRCMIAEEYSGIDLGKRDYRIFLGRDALRGNIAAAVLKVSGYTGEEVLLDPYCRHGVIPIEAALMATNTSVNKYQKDKLACKAENCGEEKTTENKILCIDEHFPHVNAAKKNAKIAGAVKQIQFSRQEIEWLDTKYPPKSIDKIVTMPPQPTIANENKIGKKYKELFHQADILLVEKGTITLVMKQHPEKILEHASKFKKIKEQKIMQGKEELTTLVLQRI